MTPHELVTILVFVATIAYASGRMVGADDRDAGFEDAMAALLVLLAIISSAVAVTLRYTLP